MDSPGPPDAVYPLVQTDDVSAVSNLLNKRSNLIEQFDQTQGACGMPSLAFVRSPEMARLFLEQGASIEKLSRWWAPGFGLEDYPVEVAEYLIARGATMTPHAAAALGLGYILEELLKRDRQCLLAKGGDGGRPLHFCRNVECARLLVERGAEVDARDDDHDSTAAQWRIGPAPEVSRFLLEWGAEPDLFMAAALGDFRLVQSLVNRPPECTTWRIGNHSGPFPGIGHQGKGGTIYQWTLGFNLTPHEVALKKGHRDVFDCLMQHTPVKSRFLVACTLPDRTLAESLIDQHPGLIEELDEEDRMLPAKFCWETNLDVDAVRLMLDLGFPVAEPEGNHGHTPLHNAAWCGHVELVELLLQRGHPVNLPDPRFQSTPLGWAIHSCVEARRHPEGNFPEVVKLLIAHGAQVEKRMTPTGHEGIDAVLNKPIE